MTWLPVLLTIIIIGFATHGLDHRPSRGLGAVGQVFANLIILAVATIGILLVWLIYVVVLLFAA